MITTCPYCQVTTSGQHEWGCPNYVVPANTTIDVERYIRRADERDALIARAEAAEARASELGKSLQAADRRAEEWKSSWFIARSRIAELERVLRMYPEWMYEKGSFSRQFCPICGSDRDDGHFNDCPRQKVLGETK